MKLELDGLTKEIWRFYSSESYKSYYDKWGIWSF